MPLGREVPDFTAIARSSFQQAIDDHALEFDSPIPRDASSEHAFIGRLSNASNLRQAARLAGVHRPQAKEVLRLVSRAGVEHQARAFAGLTLGRLRHHAAWAFSAKQRHGLPRRLDRYSQDSVWTHVCMDDATRLIPLWLVGPSATAAVAVIATEVEARWPGTDVISSAAVDVTTVEHLRLIPSTLSEYLTLKTWVDIQPAGFAKKVHLHAQALAFFVLHHNFCWSGRDGNATPAMLHGVAERPWTSRDVAALAFESEATRPSA